MKNNNIFSTILDYTIITFGVILVAFGIQYFYSPNSLAAGGLSGMALIMNNYIPTLSVATTIFLGNLILYIIAFILIGGDFGFKTIYASFALSVVIDIMERFIGSFAITKNLLLATILGTLFVAFGLAIVFARNASTGGTDILAKILSKYSTFNIGIALAFVDLFVTICGALTFGLNRGIYALIAVILNGLLVDRLINLISKFQDKKEGSII